jgi:LPXTG-site transpeptidase (sortase) family protein
VWDANSHPGPFVNLKTLQYGDTIKIRAWGLTYTYEVRESLTVRPGDVSTVLRHESLDWITLVTCEDYRSLWEIYTGRRVVRAVLVSVQ